MSLILKPILDCITNIKKWYQEWRAKDSDTITDLAGHTSDSDTEALAEHPPDDGSAVPADHASDSGIEAPAEHSPDGGNTIITGYAPDSDIETLADHDQYHDPATDSDGTAFTDMTAYSGIEAPRTSIMVTTDVHLNIEQLPHLV